MKLDLALMEKYLQRAIEEFDTTPLATQFLRRLATDIGNSERGRRAEIIAVEQTIIDQMQVGLDE